MTDTKQSRLTATLLCVTPPDEHQEQGIRAFLQKKYGEDVALTIQQDSSLKSGFQLHVGSEVYDWSAKGRMEQFRQQVEQLVAKNTRKDIIPLLRSSIDEFRLLAKSSEVGTVKSIGDGIAVVEGLEHAAYGEILMFDNGIKGMVQDLRRNETGCILFDNADDISAGSKVARTGKTAGVPVGDAFLGRVVDALGRPIDGGDAIPADGYRPVEEPAPGIIDRQSVDTPMETGLLSIDAMFPIGRGQRELIIGDRQTGKTAIALDAMLNQKGKNVICVYVAIGQKASSVAQLVENLRKRDAMDYCVVVSATAGEADTMQYIAPYAGCAMAEYYMHKGRDVLIIDTAGRLHNKINLMNELTKIKNVMKKVLPEAPNEVLLVLDGSTGQNAYEQAKQFTLATEVNALAITKLDGTAKGGVVIGISDQFKIPVKYIGIGEKIEDLQVFNREEFVDSLFS